MDLPGSAVEADVGQRPNGAELPGDATELEDDALGLRPRPGIAFTHPFGYISASTSSGTSDVPDTVG